MIHKKSTYFIIAALLISSVQNNNAKQFNIDTKTGCFIAVGSTAAILIAGAIGWQCSGSKYDHLTQKDKQDRKEREDERERIAQEKFVAKIKDEQFVLQNVDNLLASFMPLINEFGNQTNSQLAKNQKFQSNLVQAILGNNAQTDRLGTLNQQIWHLEQSLMKVDSQELTDTKLKNLQLLRWLREQVNSSSLARSTQNKLEHQQLTLELEKNKVTISKEQAEQERIQTKTINKEAELRQKAAQELADTAHNIQGKLNHIRTDLEDQMTTLRRSVNRQLNDLNAWQANNAKDRAETQRLLKASQHEYKRLELLLSTVEATCNTLQQFMGNFAQQLTRIERGQKSQSAFLVKEIKAVLNEYSNSQKQHITQSDKRMLETLSHMLSNMQQPAYHNNSSTQATAPMLDPADEISNTPSAYNPEFFDTKK